MRIVTRITLVVLMAVPAMAADVQWTLSGPAQVNRGSPVTWTASVAVTGSNQGLAGYAFTIAVGPQPGPTAGVDGKWGTVDDDNLANIQLSPANWEKTFKVQGAAVTGSVKDPPASGGPGMGVLPSAGTNALVGELIQVGAGYLDWVTSANRAGVGIDSYRPVLLANPAASYVLHTGSIPTDSLAAGSYTVVLAPVCARVLRADLNFSQAQAGFIMSETIAGGGSFTFTVLVPEIPGDFNRDGSVNTADFALLLPCVTGPTVDYNPQSLPEVPPGCTQTPDAQNHIPADLDKDGDVDADDFGVFQRCFSGSAAADPACAE